MTGPFEVDDQQPMILQRYEGLPNNPHRTGEKSAWRRFCTWMLPWLRRKRELADDYLEAEVLDKHATALTKIADAQLKFAEARKIAAETAEIAGRLDQQKSMREIVSVEARAEDLSGSLEALEALREEIQRKLEALQVIHGGSIKVVDEDVGPLTRELSLPPASSAPDQE